MTVSMKIEPNPKSVKLSDVGVGNAFIDSDGDAGIVLAHHDAKTEAVVFSFSERGETFEYTYPCAEMVVPADATMVFTPKAL